MKILVEGFVEPPPLPYWVGLELTCPNCKTRFILELGDKVETRIEKRPNGKKELLCLCPFPKCGKVVEHVSH